MPSSSPRTLRPRSHRVSLGVCGLGLAYLAAVGCSQVASTDESAPAAAPVEAVGEGIQAAQTSTCVTIQRGGTGAVADTLLNAAQPTRNFGTTGSLTAGMSSGTQRQGLIGFDLSMIPAGSVVDSATLNLNAYMPSGTAKPVRIHRATSPWSESTVTWSSFAGAFASTVEAQIQPVAAFTWVATDVTGLVQQWVSGAAPNHGMLLERDLDGTTVYGTSESPQRPSLQVCYTPPFCYGQPDGTACDDGDGCTTGDACTAGVCGGAPLPSVACSTGLPGVCAVGATSCSGGAVHCDQTVFPSSETCNGLDDDCDGTVDDGAAASCPGGANATATCSSGACGLSCGAGFGDCDGDPANGCETSLSTSANCGGCGVSCGGGVCSNGTCLTGASCAAILLAHPGAPSGAYTLDADGAGPIAPVTVYCDMTTDGGGWTYGAIVTTITDTASRTRVPGITNFGAAGATVAASEYSANLNGIPFSEVRIDNFATGSVVKRSTAATTTWDATTYLSSYSLGAKRIQLAGGFDFRVGYYATYCSLATTNIPMCFTSSSNPTAWVCDTDSGYVQGMLDPTGGELCSMYYCKKVWRDTACTSNLSTTVRYGFAIR